MTQPASGHYGALEVPAQVPPAGEAVTDPALTLIGAYLRAFLNTYGGAAWASVAPSASPGNPAVPVRRFYTHDPREVSLNEHDFPSLYLFRTGGDPPERIAEDWRVTTDTIVVLWIFPRDGSQDIARTRRPFAAGLAKLIDKAVWRMRDPCFVVQGDNDPTAAARGSDIFVLGRIQELAPTARWELVDITVGAGADAGRSGEGVTYRGLLFPLLIRERDNQGPAPLLPAPFPGPTPPGGSGPPADPGVGSLPGQLPDPAALAGFADSYGVAVTLTTSDGAVVTAEYHDDPLP